MRRRLVPSLAACAVLLTGLTACSPGADSPGAGARDDSCASSIGVGAMSESVTVMGSAREGLEVSIPTGVEIAGTQRTIVPAADARGEQAVENTLAMVDLAFYDAASGEEIRVAAGRAEGRAGSYTLIREDLASPLSESLRCSYAGDRVIIAASEQDSLPWMQQFGGNAGTELVIVADVVQVTPLRAEGHVRRLPSGFPAVVTDETGQPGVVLPPRPASEGVAHAARIDGEGPVVEADDVVLAQVLTVGWDGRERENSWGDYPVIAGSEEQIAQTGNTYREGLTGERVGSQVVVVESDGDDARVSVVEILGVG